MALKIIDPPAVSMYKITHLKEELRPSAITNRSNASAIHIFSAIDTQNDSDHSARHSSVLTLYHAHASRLLSRTNKADEGFARQTW